MIILLEKTLKKLHDKLIGGKNKKEVINTLISLIVILALLLFLYNTIYSESPQKDNVNFVNDMSQNTLNSNMILNDEVRLEEILSQINGVGNVDVMITYETGPEIIPAVDVQENSESREERSNDGGTILDTSKDSSKSIVTVNNEDLLVLKEIKPRVKGVIIVAEGAENMVIKNNIINAAAAVFDISVDRVVVFQKSQSIGGSVINE